MDGGVSIEVAIGCVVLAFLIPLILAALFNKYLPEYFCHAFGWHLAPKERGFDGCSLNGKCPRCGKSVMQDSQGNWF